MSVERGGRKHQRSTVSGLLKLLLMLRRWRVVWLIVLLLHLMLHLVHLLLHGRLLLQ